MIRLNKYNISASRPLRINETGSITPLISIYFTIAMLAIFVAANLASVYTARRDLINTTEAALSRATQELDEYVYYYQIPTSLLVGGGEDLVPINCSDAGARFAREIQLLDSETALDSEKALDSNANANAISISGFSCDGRELTASVERRSPLPFAVKILGVDSYTNRVSVKAVAQYR